MTQLIWRWDNFTVRLWLIDQNKSRELCTWRRDNFKTALKLSLEFAPSGQFNLEPRLKYFSEDRLQKKMSGKDEKKPSLVTISIRMEMTPTLPY